MSVRRRAFTLIETMAVVVIITSMASLLLPTIAGAKQASKRTVCVSNLHSIAVASSLYQSDFDDHYPQAVNGITRIKPNMMLGRPREVSPQDCPIFLEALHQYVDKAILVCPEDSGANFAGHLSSPTLAGDNGGSSYIFAELFDGQTSSTWSKPANLNWCMDGWSDWHWRKPPSETSVFHRKNALAYDGHARGVIGFMVVPDWTE